jgi:hypothetical protein
MDSTIPRDNKSRLKAILFRQRNIIFCLILVMVTLAVYWQVGEYEFVSFDDGMYVSENQRVQQGLTAESIKWAFGFTGIAYWHPLTWLSHMLDVQLYGLEPGMHHITNLILHILNGLLLFLVLKGMTADFWRSCFVAALFVLHPINVESVAWIAERKNVLSTFFLMLTLLTYWHYSKHPSYSRYLLTVVVFAMGLMSKPLLVTLPLVLLLIDFWPLERIRLIPSSSGGNGITAMLPKFQGTPIGYLLLEKTPFFILAIVSVILSIISARGHGIVLSVQEMPLHLRLANAIVSYMGYIGKTVWPHKLAVFYPYPEMVPLWLTIATGLWLLGATFLMLHKMERFPYLTVGWLWYLMALLPNIGLVQAGLWPAMADRWAYIPLIGIFIIAAWGFPELLEVWHHKKAGLAAMAATVISVILVVTWIQIRYWANSISLYSNQVLGQQHITLSTRP